MKWITRAHVHVDRVACPWLIKRFIDSEAEFLFVAASAVKDTAVRENAVPFDVPDAELGHKDGHCSFVSLINTYGLKDPALLMLSEIVDAADTGSPDADPYARGLEAIAQGYSLRYPEDEENIMRQFEVYDSLYAFCRLKVVGQAVTQPRKGA